MATALNIVSQTEFRDRLVRAWLELQVAKNDRVTQSEIAAWMTELGVPMTQGSVSAWFRGDAGPRDLKTYICLAQVLSWGPRGEKGWIDPGWLAFGDASDAPDPGTNGGAWRAIQQGPQE